MNSENRRLSEYLDFIAQIEELTLEIKVLRDKLSVSERLNEQLQTKLLIVESKH
jgi:hypothetical protein